MNASASNGARFPLWLMVAAGCLISMINFGPRSSMGFFQLPIIEAHGWTRENYSLAMAIQNLMWGIGSPLAGALADRWGTARVLASGAILYGIGMLVMANAETTSMLYLGAGFIVGLGVAGSAFGLVMASLGRVVTPEKRTLIFGIATAAGSFGQFLFAPLTRGLIQTQGWYNALFILAGILMLVPLLSIALQGKPGPRAAGSFEQSVGGALTEAIGHRSYLLLTAGFFVCGFQIAFITTHFPAYLNDIGMEARWGVISLMLIGAFNIVGSLSSGWIGSRMPKRYLLSGIYIGRAVLFTAFLLIPVSPVTVVIFSSLLGLLWLSTVPPTNSLVAIMFGTRYLGMLAGLVFLSHQVGSFLGVWLGGRLYDLNHSYAPVWWLSVALGLFAGLVHLPIRETAALRPGATPAE